MIPIYLKNRDTHYGVTMARQLLERDLLEAGRITIIDGGSTEPGLLDLYSELLADYPTDRLHVHFSGKNTGIHSLWNIPYKWEHEVEEFYVVTDSDLECDQLPRDTLQVLSQILRDAPEIIKAGLALRLDDLTAENSMHPDKIREEQEKFWQQRHPLEFQGRSLEAWEAHIDTTFGMYRKGKGWQGYAPSVRVAGEYAVRHLPWYYTPENVPVDFLYYLGGIDRSIPYGYTGTLADELRGAKT